MSIYHTITLGLGTGSINGSVPGMITLGLGGLIQRYSGNTAMMACPF